MIAVFQLNTSNLARLANVLDLTCKKESKYRRLKRFFTDAEIDFQIFARLILAMVKPDGKYILALDRTEWKYGLVWVNITGVINRGRKHFDSGILEDIESERQFSIM
ncbi:MAG: hypothetical protein M3Q78_02375 [Acidobacteriota bacterium]|nr:hypothetical protein [Acidobacteriota bacterium]